MDKTNQRHCKSRGCKIHIRRGKWCTTHRKEVRKEQLRINNLAWNARTAKGKAEHYLWYNDRPTDYALSSETRTEKAIQHAKELHPDWTMEHIRKLVAEARKTRGANVKAEKQGKPARKAAPEKKTAPVKPTAPAKKPKKPKKLTAMERVIENGKKAAAQESLPRAKSKTSKPRARSTESTAEIDPSILVPPEAFQAEQAAVH